MSITQIGKGNRREGVDGHAHAHNHQIFGMIGIADGTGYRMDKQCQQHHKEQRGEAYSVERGRIDLFRILARTVHKPEEGGLHTVSQDDDEQGNVGIDVGDDAILSSGSVELRRLNRYKQIADETGCNTAQAVDGRVFCKRF